MACGRARRGPRGPMTPVAMVQRLAQDGRVSSPRPHRLRPGRELERPSADCPRRAGDAALDWG